MKFLLDTNTCVQYLRYGKKSPVAAKLAAQHPGDIALCAVVVGELLFGALRSKNVAQSLAEVQAFRSGFLSLPFDDAAAKHYAEVRADLAAIGTPIGPADTMIAAIAHRLTLVMHNTNEFSRVAGLNIEDWQN